MFKKTGKIIISLLILTAVIVTISGRGCPKRSRDKIGSSNEWAGIAAPSSLTATAFSSSEIRLSWQDNSNNEDGFEIERYSNPATGYSFLVTVSTDAVSYSDMVQPYFTTYYYRVRAFNNTGDYSGYSNEASAQTVRPEWQAIAAGDTHSLALNINRSLWSWGSNLYWQLGLGYDMPDFVGIPTMIGNDSDWLAVSGTNLATIAGGYWHTLAIKTNNTLWTFGTNGNGELGLGDTDYRAFPSPVGVDSDWSIVAGGTYHSIGLKTDGTLWAWGDNEAGQLGFSNTNVDRLTPIQVGSTSNWLTAATFGRHNIAVKTNRTLWAWGWNQFGQLGDGTTITRTAPSQIGAASDWSVVSASYTQSFAIKTDGTLWGWGLNGSYSISAPTRIGTDSDWSTVSAGGSGSNNYFTIALKTNPASGGTLWSWGNNNYGQLGLGDYTSRSNPTQIGTSSNWAAVVAGGYHSLALSNGGILWVWGGNDYYQLGLGNTMNENVPINTNLPQPGNLLAQAVSYSQIDLSWADNSSNETGFIIERSNSLATGYSLLATVSANTTSYPDTGLEAQTLYYYRAKASYPASGGTGGNIDSTYSNGAVGLTILWFSKVSPIPGRQSQSMVWDGQRVILFGGEYEMFPYYRNDLWWYDPGSNTWTDRTPTSSPQTRSDTAMVWDGQRVIMFGGSGFQGAIYNDLWWYDPIANTWTDRTPTSSPPARYGHTMVWDGQRVIMFGGTDDSTYFNDLWWYDPIANTWTEQTPVNSPPARYGHSMSWDGTRAIMFGGYGTSPTYKNDLWWYYPGSNTWAEQTPANPPPARSNHSMVWDGTRAIMFGGSDGSNRNDLWWYDPASGTTGAWLQQTTASSPSARAYQSMVWDGTEAIMFGGTDDIDYKNDLWWYEPIANTWTEKIAQGTPVAPAVRVNHAMVWDGTGAIMFGGANPSSYKNDLWRYDPTSGTNGAWIQKAPIGDPPPARHSHTMVWDGSKGIMFGGYTGSIYKNDLWWYEPGSNTWINKSTTAISPTARGSHAMVWDGTEVIMFGGWAGQYSYNNELWWYNPGANSWTRKYPATSPSPRASHAMVWDGTEVIMFGGRVSGAYLKNELWWYSPVSNTWTQKTPTYSPSPRQNCSMVWDGQRVIMFDGSGGVGSVRNDIWLYEPASNTWIGPITSKVQPSARYSHTAVWDTVGQRMIMFGGANAIYYKNDLWWWW